MGYNSSTIYALATAPGRSGIAVFRISGPDATLVLSRLCHSQSLPDPRRASLRSLYHPQSGVPLDRALVIWFQAPNSYTGEDLVEIHAHGGRAVVVSLAEALGELPGFRFAEPGEFTRRAFENGRMDLMEAEAVIDLINAETEAQRRQALRQVDGVLSRLYEDWRGRLIKTLAYLEASIDFSEEELPSNLLEAQSEELLRLGQEIKAHLKDHRRGERLRDGFSIAILGAPNVGKSSLMNTLAARDVAIVSSQAGTTRDILEVHLDLKGFPVIIADTAGLRTTTDAIETEGIRRAQKRAQEADLKLLIFDSAQWPRRDVETAQWIDENSIIIYNKSDLLSENDKPKNADEIFISAITGKGIAELLDQISKFVEKWFGHNTAPALTRARHRECLEACLGHLGRTAEVKALELRAEDVRLATRALGRLTGRVDVEDLLDVIFRDFCIGK